MKQVKVEGKRIAKLKSELFENSLNGKAIKPLKEIAEINKLDKEVVDAIK